jgi:WD40 repeat protein
MGAPQPLWRFRGPRGYPGHQQVIRAALSADGRRLAIVTPGILMTVDLEKRVGTGTDDQRMLYGASGVNGMDLSPDGRHLVVTGLVGRRARLYAADDLRGGFRSLGDAEDYDTAVAFHPDGRRVFVGNEDGKVRVFDVEDRTEIRGAAWQAQTGAVIALAVSTDGRLVATSGDRTLRFWDAEAAVENGIRRERLQVGVPTPRNWMRFAEGDRVFLHVAPGQPLEAWEAP